MSDDKDRRPDLAAGADRALRHDPHRPPGREVDLWLRSLAPAARAWLGEALASIELEKGWEMACDDLAKGVGSELDELTPLGSELDELTPL